jgi:hypothetical protein
MQRLIARFLLLIALAGNFVPLALAVTTSPAHACCVRKVVHKCHEAGVASQPPSAQASSSQVLSNQTSVHAAANCGHDCCRGAITAQWASPRFSGSTPVAYAANGTVTDSQSSAPSTETFLLQSSRAPPVR